MTYDTKQRQRMEPHGLARGSVRGDAHDNKEILEALASHLDDTGGGMIDDNELRAIQRICPNVTYDRYGKRNALHGLMACTNAGMSTLSYKSDQRGRIYPEQRMVMETFTRYYSDDDIARFKMVLDSIQVDLSNDIGRFHVGSFNNYIFFDNLGDVADESDNLVSDGKIIFKTNGRECELGIIKIEDASWHQNNA